MTAKLKTKEKVMEKLMMMEKATARATAIGMEKRKTMVRAMEKRMES